MSHTLLKWVRCKIRGTILTRDSQCVGCLIKFSNLMRHKRTQSCLCILVKAFKQRYSESILHGGVAGLIQCAICWHIVIFPKFLLIRPVGIWKFMEAVFVIKSPYKTWHRYILTSYHRVIFIFFLLPESNFVTVVHIELLPFVTAMGGDKVCRDCLGVDWWHTTLKLCRVSDIKVVRNTSILLINHIRSIEESLKLISVTGIGAWQTPAQTFGSLIIVTTFWIRIIHECSYLSFGWEIAWKKHSEIVLSDFPTTAGVIADYRHRDTCVIKFSLRKAR